MWRDPVYGRQAEKRSRAKEIEQRKRPAKARRAAEKDNTKYEIVLGLRSSLTFLATSSCLAFHHCTALVGGGSQPREPIA